MAIWSRTSDTASTTRTAPADAETTRTAPVDTEPPAREARPFDHREAVARGAAEHGGVKVGSAFFGWLTAMGMAVLLTAVVVAAGAAVGVSTGTSATEASNAAQNGTSTAQTVGLIGGIALLVILFVSYYCGGYVAGRMARFNGAKQGLAVWLWAVVIALVAAAAVAIAGTQYDVLGSLNSFPRLPVSDSTLTTGGIIALVVVAVASLVGAVLGGVAGMRYHRRVDSTTFEPYVD